VVDVASVPHLAHPQHILSIALAWDTAGLRFQQPYAGVLQSIYCFLPEEECFSPEPGWDVARIVRGYEKQVLHEGNNEIAVSVHFDGVGWISRRGIEEEEVILVETVETIYLQTIRNDFIEHRDNISLVHDIGMSIVQRIDSLFTEQRADIADMDLIRDIMVTRGYDRTILAYRDILNGDYISDPELKLMVARHTALFEGHADVKREWDNQWDITARPYIYKHGLFSHPPISKTAGPPKSYTLYRDPEFRTILWDRRMFAYDVTYITPALLESADAIIGRIDELLNK
jgi:hypothetical protein